MTVAATTGLLGEVILARLLTAAKHPPGPARLREELGRFFRHPPAAEAWQECVNGLADAGLLTVEPYRLTEAGRAHALEFLGLKALPPRLNWKSLCARYLVPKALGVSAEAADLRKRVTDPEGLSAYLLKTRNDLPLGAGATLTATLEALACKEAGFEGEVKWNRVKLAALNRLLGNTGEPLNAAQLKKRLPARLLGATGPKADALRQAVLRDWLDADGRADEASRAFDLPAFAGTVRAAARDCPTGRFGNNKVFISHVWRRLAQEPGVPRLDLPAFKARLVEANRAGLLRLSRADLVQVMDPADVAESETPYLNTAFHFVLLEGERP